MQENVPMPRKSKKGIIILFFLLLVIVLGGGAFLLKSNNKTDAPAPSNSNEETSNSNQNEVRSDKVSIVAEDVKVLKQYGKFLKLNVMVSIMLLTNLAMLFLKKHYTYQ